MLSPTRPISAKFGPKSMTLVPVSVEIGPCLANFGRDRRNLVSSSVNVPAEFDPFRQGIGNWATIGSAIERSVNNLA